MSVSVSSAPVGFGEAADNRMMQRRDSMAADERAKKVSKLPYDENVGKLSKFYRQGNCPKFTDNWEIIEMELYIRTYISANNASCYSHLRL